MATVLTTILALGLLLISSLYLPGQVNQLFGQSTIPSGNAGGQVDVLYAGSLISVMETKIGPAFSHLGFVYRGEGHGSTQDDNMIIDGQRFPDVFISVGTESITKLIDNNPSLAKWSIGFASDELVIAYNPKSHFASDFEKVKAGSIPWYQVLSKPGIKFLRSDPLLDPKGCYTVIAARLADKLYHNSTISSSILGGERNQNQLRPEEILPTLLETGEADAIPAYKHEAISRRHMCPNSNTFPTGTSNEDWKLLLVMMKLLQRHYHLYQCRQEIMVVIRGLSVTSLRSLTLLLP